MKESEELVARLIKERDIATPKLKTVTDDHDHDPEDSEWRGIVGLFKPETANAGVHTNGPELGFN